MKKVTKKAQTDNMTTLSELNQLVSVYLALKDNVAPNALVDKAEALVIAKLDKVQ